jgi:hypothetical protein
MKNINNRILDSYPKAVFIYIALASLGVLNFIMYFSNWGGDPEIHIIFAKNFLEGYPLQFNQGDYSSGETSVLYLLILAFFGGLMNPENLPWLMKVIGLSSLIFICVIILKLRLNNSERVGILLYMVSVPSVFYQAFLGMENFLFASLVVFLIYSIFMRKDIKIYSHIPYIVLYLVLSIIGFLLRPEMLIVVAGFAVTFAIRKQFTFSVISILAIIISIILWKTIEFYTGTPLHGAGAVRATLSQSQSFAITLQDLELLINPKPVYFFLSTAPFLLILIVFLFNSIKEKTLTTEKVSLLVLFCIIVGGPLLLHFFNIFPNTHFSRYQLYLFFSTALISSFLWTMESRLNFKVILVPMVLWSGVLWSYENTSRGVWFNRGLSEKNLYELEYSQSMQAKETMSNKICKLLDCNKGETVVVAAQEVQIRLRLDDRFVVRSLDGIVDYQLARFIDNNNCINHMDYIKHRSIDLLLSFPDYNPADTQCEQSLSNVREDLQRKGYYEGYGLSIKAAKLDGKVVGLITKNEERDH